LRPEEVDGRTTFQPGMCAQSASKDCECCAALPRPNALLGANDQRHFHLAAGHVTELGDLVDQRVSRHQGKIHVHDFDHRAQPGHGGSGRQPHKGRLRNGGVAHPPCAKLGFQPLGHGE